MSSAKGRLFSLGLNELMLSKLQCILSSCDQQKNSFCFKQATESNLPAVRPLQGDREIVHAVTYNYYFPCGVLH